MRIAIDIPDGQLRELAEICAREGTSRAAIIRDAIASYLAARRQRAQDDAFGLWQRHGLAVDGSEHQTRLRDEWQ
ncbi:CopG family ribbon-helix-helix protein [Inquilinus limosus]|uniref:CopG family ribbon-helix-helix protein n=1 Tax=Inquilinus limosus TaxID=171674 RepID=UPI00047D860C|nr:ribbon-helix-helix protein, CopG family [Inquilinus limosus]